MKVLCLLLVLAFVGCIVSEKGEWFSVNYNPQNSAFSVSSGKDEQNNVAWALYADEVNTTGWARLNLESSADYSDDIQARGAGYLEGWTTMESIWQTWLNTIYNDPFTGSIPADLSSWFGKNAAFIKLQVAKNLRDPYWIQVGLVEKQLQAMADGYNAAAVASGRKDMVLNFVAFQIMNAAGDLETIQQVISDLKGIETPLPTQIQNVIGDHCSSLVKVTENLSELYAGHTTWSTYCTMLRTFKSYTLRYRDTPGTESTTTLFSSYPGVLSSIDDFYQLSHNNLVVMETTNGCFNSTLRKEHVKPESVLSWERVVVANRMAKSGSNWIDVFSKYNSGTYNNQWIVVDYNLFTPYEPLRDGTLHIAEQIPGDVVSGDVTEYLRLGYWPSFNIPFFKSVFDRCEFPSIASKYGSWFTYSLSPRAEIFRRDANNVKTLQDAMDFLRYNNWQKDPLSAGNPGNQISSRFDLVPKNADPSNPYLVRNAFGGIDSKATSRGFVKLGRVLTQSGPTLGGKLNNLPPFDWDKFGTANITHVGVPNRFAFPDVVMPTGQKASS